MAVRPLTIFMSRIKCDVERRPGWRRQSVSGFIGSTVKAITRKETIHGYEFH